MVPMRDGMRLATDIYRPKDTTRKVPTVWVRTPYNFNFWDVRNGVPADMSAALNAVKRGYAYVVQNERGHFFSEGSYDILGPPSPTATTRSTGSRLSRGRTARWGRPAVRPPPSTRWPSRRSATPAFAAMNAQGFGAGVGRVGPYYEQGNWYRGGAIQMLFITWLYGEQNQVPDVPARTSRRRTCTGSRSFDLAPQMPPVNWDKGAVAPAGAGHHQGGRRPARHLRRRDAGAIPAARWSAHAERPGLVQGRAVARRHAARRARTVVHVVVRRVGRVRTWPVQPRAEDGKPRDGRPAVGRHRAGHPLRVHPRHRNTVVGERSMGDARLDYDASPTASSTGSSRASEDQVLDTLPKVPTSPWAATSGSRPTPGRRKGRSDDVLPVERRPANTLDGDGGWCRGAAGGRRADAFAYDPKNPVRRTAATSAAPATPSRPARSTSGG
jgi:uncharacterized protein